MYFWKEQINPASAGFRAKKGFRTSSSNLPRLQCATCFGDTSTSGHVFACAGGEQCGRESRVSSSVKSMLQLLAALGRMALEKKLFFFGSGTASDSRKWGQQISQSLGRATQARVSWMASSGPDFCKFCQQPQELSYKVWVRHSLPARDIPNLGRRLTQRLCDQVREGEPQGRTTLQGICKQGPVCGESV